MSEAEASSSSAAILRIFSASASLAREAETPPSSSPIGYEIDSEGRLTELEEGQRPDCE